MLKSIVMFEAVELQTMCNHKPREVFKAMMTQGDEVLTCRNVVKGSQKKILVSATCFLA